VSWTTVYTPTNTGDHTFTAKYRSQTGGTVVHFAKRRLVITF
jgi:hypothetical protein